MTEQSSSIFEYDHSLNWTENNRHRSYALCAATDQDVLAYATSEIVAPPLGSTNADALIKWARDEAAATVKYFENEHNTVVADAEVDAAPVDIDRAVRLGTEMAHEQYDEQLSPIDVGPEAVAYVTDRLKSKIDRDAVCNRIGEVYSGFLTYRYLKGQRGGKKVVYRDHRHWQLEPKPPAPTDDWLVDCVQRHGPLSIHRWHDLFPRRSFHYALYCLKRLERTDRLARAWMPDIPGDIAASLIYALKPAKPGASR